MKKAGIWIDREKAHVVSITEGGETMATIYSGMEFYHPKGGSRTRNAKWGPQDEVHDSKYLERQKHQLKDYFRRLAEAISDSDAIAIFGPADTNVKFSKELRQHHRNLAAKIVEVGKADSMTANQLKAMVRNYFMPKTAD